VGGVPPPSRVDARFEARLARQSVLTRETPLQLSVVIHSMVPIRSRRGPSRFCYFRTSAGLNFMMSYI